MATQATPASAWAARPAGAVSSPRAGRRGREVVAAAQMRDRVLEVGRSRSAPCPPAAGAPAETQTSGSVAFSEAGPARTSGCRISGALASARRYSCRPGSSASPSARPGSAPRGRSRPAPCASRRGAGAGEAGRGRQAPVAGAGDQHRPVADLVQQAAERRQVAAAQGPRPRTESPERADLRQDLHICSGAEMPSRPRAAAIVRLVSRQRPRRERSTPSPSAPTTWQSR